MKNLCARPFTSFANKEWQKAYDLFHNQNDNIEANLLASFCKLYCAAQLELKNTEKLAYHLLEKTDFEFWPYLSEHNFPRLARRFAFHFLAYTNKEEGTYDTALDFILDALAINSPIMEVDNTPLLELKVEIYLAINQQTYAFFTIQKILDKAPKNERFIDIIQSQEYLNHLKIYDLNKLKKGKETETAIEALKRFKLFLRLQFEDDNDEIEYNAPCFFEAITETDLAETESRLQFKLPPSYRSFLLKNGLFRLGKQAQYNSKMLSQKQINTLYVTLEKQQFNGLQSLSKKSVEISKNLIPFSYGDESLQAVWYYCFDKNSRNEKTGEMAIYAFNQDDWNFEIQPLSKKEDFNCHIKTLINEQIKSFLD